MKPFYVYILQCRDGSYYIGHTDDFERRMTQYICKHGNGYVSARLTFKIVFVETCGTRVEAIIAERKLKGWSRKKKKSLNSGGFSEVQKFWKNYKKIN